MNTLGAGSAVAALLVGLLAVIWCAVRFHKRLGGYTGDCLGAAQQVAFTVLLLGFVLRV